MKKRQMIKEIKSKMKNHSQESVKAVSEYLKDTPDKTLTVTIFGGGLMVSQE